MKTEDLKIMLDVRMMDWLRREADLRSCSMAAVIRGLISDAMRQKRKA